MNNSKETNNKKATSTHKVSKIFSILMLILIIGSLLFATYTSIDTYIKYGNVAIETINNLV